jgi:hypothetical protein
VRIDGTLDYQDYWRRSDHSLVGRNVIPRVKLEYQITRAIFMRLVGEYDLSEHDDLRDETRTFCRSSARQTTSVKYSYLLRM